MDEYNQKLTQAISQQELTDTFNLFIASPMLTNLSKPNLTKDELKTDTLTVRIPNWVKKELQSVSELEDIPISVLASTAITNSLMKHRATEEARKLYLNEAMRLKEEMKERLNPDEGIKAIFNELRKSREEKGQS